MSIGRFDSSGVPATESVSALPRTPATGAAVMEAVELRKYFPVRELRPGSPRRFVHAVESTSLALYPGRALALVGESGSGKTTVARLLARLYEPTAGRILF